MSSTLIITNTSAGNDVAIVNLSAAVQRSMRSSQQAKDGGRNQCSTQYATDPRADMSLAASTRSLVLLSLRHVAVSDVH